MEAWLALTLSVGKRNPQLRHMHRAGLVADCISCVGNASACRHEVDLARPDHLLVARWDETFAVVKACFDQLRASGCTRIGVHLKVDWRDGPAGRLQSKTAKVEQVLGRRLNR